MNSKNLKRFSILGLLSALTATVIFTLAGILFIIWTDGLKFLPSLQLTALLTVPAIASYFAWFYFFTGKRAHAWAVTAIFAGFGIPLILLGIYDAFNPPQRHEMITLEVSHAAFAVIYTIPVLLSLALFRELQENQIQPT